MHLDLDNIHTMTYTEFIGHVKQWNVPPGAFSTVERWRLFGQVSETSSILEIACTTGFSSRELARDTGAAALGIDLCPASISAAREHASKYAPSASLEYEVADAMSFEPARAFSHLVTGAALRFFTDPAQAVARFTSWLKPDGRLLSCEFYCIDEIPPSLLAEASEVFGIDVTQAPYKTVMSIYRDLSLLYEERISLEPETPSELEHYCESYLAQYSREHPEAPSPVLEAVHDRLLQIKDVSNRLRPYQGYNVLVHRKDSRFSPSRFTELF